MVNFEEYDKIVKECKELAMVKNIQYGDEPLKLFHGQGIFIKVFDKTERLKYIYENRYNENDDFSKSPEDTIIDLINYAIYLLMSERGKI